MNGRSWPKAEGHRRRLTTLLGHTDFSGAVIRRAQLRKFGNGPCPVFPGNDCLEGPDSSQCRKRSGVDVLVVSEEVARIVLSLCRHQTVVVDAIGVADTFGALRP